MKTQTTMQFLAALAALTLAFPAGLVAQDDFFFDDEEFEEEQLEPLYENFLEVGVGYQDDGTRHFGRNSGLISKGFSPLVNIRINARPDWDGDSTLYWRLEGYRLGWDSRRLETEVGHQGTQKFGFSWRQMPNHRIEGAVTPFNGLGSGFFGLPPGWEAIGNTTSGMTRLRDDLRSFNIDTERRRMDLNYWRSLSDRFDFNIEYRNDVKDGSRLVGAIFGFTGGNPRSVHLPAPVDQTTEIIDATLEFNADRYVLGVGYHGSFFDNNQDSITWQNAFGQHPQWQPGTGFPDGLGRLSLFPDNNFHQARAWGAWFFGDRTRLNADIAFGRMKQDDAFLPFTINQQIDIEAPLPVASLDGRINTTVLNLRLTHQPVDRLNLSYGLRYDDRDNNTSQHAFRLVGADSEAQKSAGSARINLPYSLETVELKADAVWRFTRRHRLFGGLSYKEIERDDFAEASELDEWGVRAGFRGNPTSRFSYNVEYLFLDREYDEYDGRAPLVAGHVPGTVDPDDFENHPNLRKFNMSDRERNQFRARLDFQPVDVVNLGSTLHYRKDEFDDQRFGLNEAKSQSYHFDVGYYPTEHFSLTGYYSHDRIEADQSGRDWPGFAPQLAFEPGRNWFVDHNDKIDTAGVSLEFSDFARRFETLTRAGINQPLDAGFEWLIMRARTSIDVTTAELLSAEPLPDAISRLNGYKFWARYRFRPQWNLGLSVEHERFDSRNFAVDNVDIDTLANVLLLGQQSPSYNVTWVAVSLGYRF